MGEGEKGVSGVPGPPVVLVVPADVRFNMRPLVLMGVMMLEEPDVSEDLDWELESAGGGLLAALGARSLLENRPIFAAVVLRTWMVSVVGGFRRDRPVSAVCRWPCRDSTAGPGTALVTQWGRGRLARRALRLDGGGWI